jgi:lipopolysaccharide/colanic/teichoic acid biosynthesis glycosyltransferase
VSVVIELRQPTSRVPALARSKRVVDLVAGLLLSVLSLPVVLALAAFSATRFRAFPFFVQERIGLHGLPIRCIKIRSLAPNVPPYLDKADLQDRDLEERWARAMRRLHLDELPQFWQVVFGTMSLVGPRPMIASIVDRMPDEVAHLRHSVRPGVTGPWQVSVDGPKMIADTCDYDIAYIRHASARVDLRILLLTAVQSVGAAKRPKADVFKLMGVRSHEPRVARLGPGVGDHRNAGRVVGDP